MIEIYFFVNPIGVNCFNMENELLRFIDTEYGKKKILFRFLPLVNLRTIGDVLQTKGLPVNDIQVRNDLFATTYSAALDVKAAQLQGKKKGRLFLLRLQDTVGCQNIPYSKELSEQLFEEIGGDLAMFKEDRCSEFTKKAFISDQQIANEMGIVKHPSAVVYNYACDRDFGVLVEGTECIKSIKELCKTSDTTVHLFQGAHELKASNDRRIPHNPGHLSLLSN